MRYRTTFHDRARSRAAFSRALHSQREGHPEFLQRTKNLMRITQFGLRRCAACP